jgi:hypothetical protein
MLPTMTGSSRELTTDGGMRSMSNDDLLAAAFLLIIVIGYALMPIG